MEGNRQRVEVYRCFARQPGALEANKLSWPQKGDVRLASLEEPGEGRAADSLLDKNDARPSSRSR